MLKLNHFPNNNLLFNLVKSNNLFNLAKTNAFKLEVPRSLNNPSIIKFIDTNRNQIRNYFVKNNQNLLKIKKSIFMERINNIHKNQKRNYTSSSHKNDDNDNFFLAMMFIMAGIIMENPIITILGFFLLFF